MPGFYINSSPSRVALKNLYPQRCVMETLTEGTIKAVQLWTAVPVDKRLNYALYKKWIMSKYPEAAKYKLEITGGLISEGEAIGFIRKLIYRGPNKLKCMFGRSRDITSGMNPLDYWIKHNSEAKQFLERYEKKGYLSMPRGSSE